MRGDTSSYRRTRSLGLWLAVASVLGTVGLATFAINAVAGIYVHGREVLLAEGEPLTAMHWGAAPVFWATNPCVYGLLLALGALALGLAMASVPFPFLEPVDDNAVDPSDETG